MTRKIFKSIFFVAAIAILASLMVTMVILYQYFVDVQDKHLSDELSLAAKAVETEGPDYINYFKKSDFRLTLISKDGTVISDTKKDASKMKNHGKREEVKEALDEGYGTSSRYSSTMLQKTVYKAKKLNDGNVIRISSNRATAGVIAMGIIQPGMIVILISLIISGLLAHRLSNRIVDPLNSLDLEHPLENNNYEELSPLLRKINSQHVEIRSQLKMLEAKKNEFHQITSQMREALILLDGEGRILSMNESAFRLFDTGQDAIGKSFITNFRNHELSQAISAANEEGYSEIHLTLDERIYQFNISRISSFENDDEGGIVILAFDITEQSNAEKRRREFTANVSHELKTPLQSIIGSAELIENNLVKPSDTKKFISKIRTEADRLVILIDEIISLAKLDEGIDAVRTDVNILELAREACSSLNDSAKLKNVSISIDGEDVILHNSIRTLLKEAIYNLCDNAVKYNVEGGNVKINISETMDNVIISIQDTGIGIPQGDQERVFERFYRSDKSHSRETGGTGLGLSIVKHAVAFHNGDITVKSEEGKGTEIILSLPNKSE